MTAVPERRPGMKAVGDSWQIRDDTASERRLITDVAAIADSLNREHLPVSTATPIGSSTFCTSAEKAPPPRDGPGPRTHSAGDRVLTHIGEASFGTSSFTH